MYIVYDVCTKNKFALHMFCRALVLRKYILFIYLTLLYFSLQC